MPQQRLQKADIRRNAGDAEFGQSARRLAGDVRETVRSGNARSPSPAANRNAGWCDSRHSRSHPRARQAPMAVRTRSARRRPDEREPSVCIVSRLTRACIAMPRGGGMSCWRSRSSASVWPRAISSCARTRSMPVTSSVTVCSTCSRTFASMKANRRIVRIGRCVHQEFERAGIQVIGSGCQCGRRVQQALADRRPQERRRGDLDQLLAFALQAAFALPQMRDRAAAVAQHLHLDMTRAGEQPFDVERAVAERLQRLRGTALERRCQLVRRRHHAHAAATAAGDGLHHDRPIGTQRIEERACII